MRVRTGGVALAWGLAVSAVTTISWVGVGMIGDEVSPAGPADLSQAELQRLIRAADHPTTATGQTPASATSTSPTSPGRTSTGTGVSRTTVPVPSSRRSVVTAGGTVMLACTGNQVDARSSPAQGYALEDDSEQTANRIDLAFTDGRRVWRVQATCAAGQLAVTTGEATSADND